MLRWLKSLFAWKLVGSSAAWVYKENSITRQRMAVWKGGGMSPMIAGFMRNGDIVCGYSGRYVIGSAAEHYMT